MRVHGGYRTAPKRPELLLLNQLIVSALSLEIGQIWLICSHSASASGRTRGPEFKSRRPDYAKPQPRPSLERGTTGGLAPPCQTPVQPLARPRLFTVGEGWGIASWVSITHKWFLPTGVQVRPLLHEAENPVRCVPSWRRRGRAAGGWSEVAVRAGLAVLPPATRQRRRLTASPGQRSADTVDRWTSRASGPGEQRHRGDPRFLRASVREPRRARRGVGLPDSGRDDLEIHFAGPPAGERPPGFCFVYVDDADELYDEWRRTAAPGRVERPTDHELRHARLLLVDPHGNEIRVGSAPKPKIL